MIRPPLFSSHQSQDIDLIIIGGGINGAATARDAALRGLKTVLIEKGDFASGTTSWSSRLVHGGLRYLEYFEFDLVRESLAERELLLRSAPHLVHPLLLTIPIYQSGSRTYWEIWAGMVLYDLLSFDKSLLNHRMLPPAKFKQLFRGAAMAGLKGGAQYFDAQAEYAERLCLEIVLSAQAAGATLLNYAKVKTLERQGNRISAVDCEDMLSGEIARFTLSQRGVIVNTAGPWVDQICQLGEANGQPAPVGTQQKIGGTKGSHIVVDKFPGAPDTAFYVEAQEDNRPFFILPFLGQYLIGTTDIPFSDDLDTVKANDAEIDYLIAETNRVFPAGQLTRQSVKFTYSGIRPLPYSNLDGKAKKPGAVTRDHVLFDHSREGVENMVSLIGGKLTTHRQVGEELVDWACKRGGISVAPCQTKLQPLPGAILPTDERIVAAFEHYCSADPTADSTSRDRPPVSLTSATLDHLFERYGARAFGLLQLIEETPALAEPLVAGLPDIKAQVVYAVRTEMACTLLDILRRRTMLALQANYGFEAIAAVVEVLQTYCNWSPETCQRQIDDYRRYMAQNCIPDYALADYGLAPTALASDSPLPVS